MINFFLKTGTFLFISAYFTVALFASPNSSDLPNKNETLISIPFSVSYNNISFFFDDEDFDEAIAEEAIITASDLNRRFIAIMSGTEINIIFSRGKQDIFSEIPEVSKTIEAQYLFSPYLRQFELLESERSGFFYTIEVVITVFKYSDDGGEYGSGEEEDFSLKSIGSGSSEDEALNSAIDNIIAQFEIFLSEFEEWSDGLKIIDIYQDTIVINKGKKHGIKKGDFLRSSDYLTGKTTGEFIVERAEDDISYVRPLWKKQEITPGDFLEEYNYFGASLGAYANYFIGETYSGFSTGAYLLWSRWIYVFHPYLGGEYLSISGGNFEKIDIYMPYVGVRMVRQIGYFTVLSSLSFGLGYVSGIGIEPGWEYVGGLAKIGGAWRINRRFSVGIDVGYSYYHSLDYFNAPSIAGFTIGGGGEINF